MTPGVRQKALERPGLTETEFGFQLTARGLQKGVRRARTLSGEDDRERTEILTLGHVHPLRLEPALAIQLDALSRSGI